MKVAYTPNIATEEQKQEFQRIGCTAMVQGQDGLKAAIQKMGKKDYLVVWTLADIGINFRAIGKSIADMKAHKMYIMSVYEQYDSKRGELSLQQMTLLDQVLDGRKRRLIELQMERLKCKRRERKITNDKRTIALKDLGWSHKKIASRLGCSIKTVQNSVRRYEKSLELKNA